MRKRKRGDETPSRKSRGRSTSKPATLVKSATQTETRKGLLYLHGSEPRILIHERDMWAYEACTDRETLGSDTVSQQFESRYLINSKFTYLSGNA